MRKAFVAGNWKMHLSLTGAVELARGLRGELGGVRDVDLAVFPPFVFVPAVAEVLKGSVIRVGAQNVHSKEAGAFTGEVAGPMLKDVGCHCVIIGHSERRHLFGETDKDVSAKLQAALSFGLDPLCCVGEKLEEREAGKTQEVVRRQVESALAWVSSTQMERVILAYEPVWAIGTGRNATPDQAQEAHEQIRALLAARFDSAVATAVRIQYGGSVKPENAEELMAAPDIDGFLVGGASLKVDSFARIVRAAIR
jgi:triosephosphate isomerase